MEEAEILLRNAMEHHGAAVYRLALCRMQSVQDAEDVYQDVFLRLLGQEASAWDGEHLRAWLLRVTVNKCKNLYRAKRRTEVPLTEAIPAPEAAEPSVLDEVRALRVSDRVFSPERAQAECDEKYRLWKRAVSCACGWIEKA